MKRSLLAVAALAATLFSCKSNLADPSSPALPEAVMFGSYVPSTRTAAITSANITDFGVYAFYNPSGGWTSDLTPNFMFDQKVEGSAAAGFTYSPLKYWPKSEGETISFFAYAPYKSVSNGISESSNPASAGSPVLRYELPAAEEDQVDLLVADPLPGQTAFDGLVRFNFSHALARIGVSVKTPASVIASGSSIYLNSLEIKAAFPAYGLLDLGSGEWISLAAGDLRAYPRDFGAGESGLSVGTSEYPVLTGDGYVMCLPSGSIRTSLTVTYTVVTPDSALAAGKSVIVNTVELETGVTALSGKTFTIILNLSPEAVEFDAPLVSDWEDA